MFSIKCTVYSRTVHSWSRLILNSGIRAFTIKAELFGVWVSIQIYQLLIIQGNFLVRCGPSVEGRWADECRTKMD